MEHSLSRIEAIALETIAQLPAPFAAHARDLVLQVEEMPPDWIVAEMQLEDPLELTGLYDGTPLTEKSIAEPAPMADVVWLFRKPILAELAERPEVSLAELVRHVTIHEIAHHFGWSDDDIAQIDEWWT